MKMVWIKVVELLNEGGNQIIIILFLWFLENDNV